MFFVPKKPAPAASALGSGGGVNVRTGKGTKIEGAAGLEDEGAKQEEVLPVRLVFVSIFLSCLCVCWFGVCVYVLLSCLCVCWFRVCVYIALVFVCVLVWCLCLYCFGVCVCVSLVFVSILLWCLCVC